MDFSGSSDYGSNSPGDDESVNRHSFERSPSGGSNSPRTPPCCARCRGHGLKIVPKGHKRFCKHRYCNCEKCRLTNERQRVIALQTAVRRALAQDEVRDPAEGEMPASPIARKIRQLFSPNYDQNGRIIHQALAKPSPPCESSTYMPSSSMQAAIPSSQLPQYHHQSSQLMNSVGE